MQHVKRIRRIILPSVASLATLSYKRYDFRGGGGNVIEHKICVLIYSTNVSEIFLILRRIPQNIATNEYSPSCTGPFYSCLILIKIRLSQLISEITQISNFMKIRPLGSGLYHAETRTDRRRDDEAKSRFSHFCERA